LFIKREYVQKPPVSLNTTSGLTRLCRWESISYCRYRWTAKTLFLFGEKNQTRCGDALASGMAIACQEQVCAAGHEFWKKATFSHLATPMPSSSWSLALHPESLRSTMQWYPEPKAAWLRYEPKLNNGNY